MKVSVWVEQEIEVDVPLSDLFAQLPNTPDVESVEMVKRAISSAASVLRSVADNYIAELGPSVRDVVRKALRYEAQRYDEHPEDMPNFGRRR